MSAGQQRPAILALAQAAREAWGDLTDHDTFRRFLDDRRFLRHPVAVVFDHRQLAAGDLAVLIPRTGSPSDGFVLCVHPFFRNRLSDLPLVISFHAVLVNWPDETDHHDAEAFAAALLGLTPESVYQRLCVLADALDAWSKTMLRQGLR